MLSLLAKCLACPVSLAKVALRVLLYAFTSTKQAHHLNLLQANGNSVSHFREIFVLRKPNAEAFQSVVEAIAVSAERILFFEDVLSETSKAREPAGAVHATINQVCQSCRDWHTHRFSTAAALARCFVISAFCAVGDGGAIIR
jgi:FMN phosphatase YigB (HAD superfamily)